MHGCTCAQLGNTCLQACLLSSEQLCLLSRLPAAWRLSPLLLPPPRALPGNRDKNVVKCPCCESQLTFDANERLVTVTEAAA